jgi:hypothetical protein
MQTAAVSFFLGYLLLIWLRTNAFVEYMALFRLDKFFHVIDYNNVHKEGYSGTYADFLNEYYSESFIVRLLICPVCVSFWLGVTAVCSTLTFEAMIISPLTLLFYTIFNRLL